MDIKNILGMTILALLFAFSGAHAQSAYKIGPEDVLQITFWQDNSLNAEVKVRQDGKISLDIIGEIEAAGLTTSELEKKIVRQMSRFNSAISHAVVRVVSYGYQKVYITGQVLNPGKYAFEKIPNLWVLISEAGGVAEEGDLSRVMIIRGGAEAGKVEVVNVAAAVSSGHVNDLPEIRADDTIEIPRTIGGLPSMALDNQTGTKNIYYIIGEVNQPGAQTLESNLDLMDAIALAGGPTENGDLKKVKVVSKDGSGTQMLQVDLKKYTEVGMAGRYFIRPEDNIFLPRQSEPFFDFKSLSDWITVIGAVSSILIIDRLIRDRNNSSGL
jgi:polysaccharide biosynthesis/export protein